jgi:hypothetical protein
MAIGSAAVWADDHKNPQDGLERKQNLSSTVLPADTTI